MGERCKHVFKLKYELLKKEKKPSFFIQIEFMLQENYNLVYYLLVVILD